MGVGKTNQLFFFEKAILNIFQKNRIKIIWEHWKTPYLKASETMGIQFCFKEFVYWKQSKSN